MHISLNWIKDFVDLPEKLSPEELGNLLTLKTAEVEKIEHQAENLNNVVTGKVTKLEKHPNADSLKVAQVDIGDKTVQIVCGGENLENGMYVAVTKVGSWVRWHGEGDLVEVKKVKLRGVESEGMIAASNEIGLSSNKEGPRDILDLAPATPEPGTPLAEFLELNDITFEIDNKSLTHRPDLWGHYGMAREFAAITGAKLKPFKPDVKLPEKGDSPKVDVQDFDLCLRFTALTIHNVKVEASPQWLQNRLKAIGHGTHNNIVDVTNYVMAEIGHPMHAFDLSLVKDGIVVRPATKGEKIEALDGKVYELDETMGVVANKKEATSIAGIIGGKDSGISEKTTSIVLEAANWHPSKLRRTSTKIGVRTDAVQRFEKSLDPHLPPLAILRAAELVLQLCPEATIAGPMTDVHESLPKPPTIDLNIAKCNSKIGVDIPAKDIIEILESLEFAVTKKDADNLKVTVPTHRASKDVSIEDDLIEEVARIYGYDNIPDHLPTLPTKVPEDNPERFHKHRTRELFSYGLGFSEVINYSFYGQQELDNSQMKEDGHLKVLNYLSEDQTHMRTTLIPNILKNLQLNVKYQDSVKIYEVGHTYQEMGEYFPLEEKQVAGAVLGKTPDVFYQAKGAVEAFLQKFRILPQLKETAGVQAAPYAHPNKAITYMDHSGKTIAKVFMIHPITAKNHELDKHQIALFEINFTEALKLNPGNRKYQKISKFPSIDFDVSVLIDRETPVGNIKSAIQEADKDLIKKVDLFDIYEGDKIDASKKAVAYKIILQAADRTLTDEEMSKIQRQIFANLEAIGGQIRGK